MRGTLALASETLKAWHIMPGILGFNRTPRLDDAQVEPALRRMAEPLCYNTSQSVEVFPGPRFACAVVNHGGGFEFQRPASAQRDGVRVVVDGEFFPDAGEVPAELAGAAPTIQRAEYCLHLYLQHEPTGAQVGSGNKTC